MAQRPDELNQNEETTTTRTDEEVTGNVVSVRAATAANTAAEEQDIEEDMQVFEVSRDSLTATAADSDLPNDPEQIKDEIEQTRAKMGETIDAIQEKLSLSNISEQVKEQVSEHISNAVETAKGAVYEATIGKAGNIMQNVSKGLTNVTDTMGDAGTYVVRTARSNPLPLALIGLGIGMLIFQSRSRNYSERRYEEYGDGGGGQRNLRGGDRTQGSTSMFRQVADTGGRALSTAKDTVTGAAGTAYEGVTGAASTAYKGVSTAATTAYQGVSHAASSAYQGATHLASTTGEQISTVARKGYNQYERTMEENPLAVGAIALALGAVVGLALPATQYENQWVGEYKENLVQAVEESAREALGKVQEVAGEVTKTVREQAQGQAGGQG
jgi:hypothetical protein